MVKSIEIVMAILEQFRTEEIFSEVFVKAKNLSETLRVEAV